MNYDKKMLEAWAGMATWEEFLTREGAFNNASKEVWNFIQSKYFRILQRRIDYCKKLFKEYDDWFICYVLAELYNRGNLDGSTEQVYKRPVRYWGIKTVRKNPDHAPTWAILAEAYIWVACLDGESREMPTMNASVDKQDVKISIENQRNAKRYKPPLFFIEWATRCLKKVVAVDPQEKYLRRLREFYSLKNEEYSDDKPL
jgi:hypothetical protein